MANTIKLRKGLNINLQGRPEDVSLKPTDDGLFALVPDGFEGITPKVAVKEGDKVKAGDFLFVDKKHPDVGFASPVSGTVKEVLRGERRKVMHVLVEADKQQVYKEFPTTDVKTSDRETIKNRLIEAGLFGYITQLPYAVTTTPDCDPKAIFISALRDMPLATDFEVELKGNEEAFQAGITALSKIAEVYLGIGKKATSAALTNAKDATVTVFDGPCPAGNVSVQINHISPVNKGETVWTVDPTAVIFFGRLFLTGKVDLRKTISLAGSSMKKTGYMEVTVGQSMKSILAGNVKNDDRHVRIINGNPLTGRKSTTEGYLLPHASEITAIPEGDDNNELFGWIMPRTKQYSANRSYFSWLMPKKSYNLDARIKGGERHMIMSGEYDRVIPMDIYPEYLIKAIIAEDIDKMEQLGIYEVAPEDFAVAEFIDSSKLELQHIVRQGLNMLRKENA